RGDQREGARHQQRVEQQEEGREATGRAVEDVRDPAQQPGQVRLDPVDERVGAGAEWDTGKPAHRAPPDISSSDVTSSPFVPGSARAVSRVTRGMRPTRAPFSSTTASGARLAAASANRSASWVSGLTRATSRDICGSL